MKVEEEEGEGPKGAEGKDVGTRREFHEEVWSFLVRAVSFSR